MVIIICNIPVKLLKLLQNLYFNNGTSFFNKLDFLYSRLCETTENLKIEILNNRYFLNCHTIKTLITVICKNNPELSPKNCYDFIRLLKFQNKGFVAHEFGYVDMVQTYMAQIQTFGGL